MHSYLHSAIAFLNGYSGEQPLHQALQHFFRSDKKFGSRDRRAIRDICYAAFRTGTLFATLPAEQRLLFSLYLCHSSANTWLTNVFQKSEMEAWLSAFDEPLTEKLARTGIVLTNSAHWFSFQPHISAQVDGAAFIASFIRRPAVFLRVNPGKLGKVTRKLEAENIHWTSSAVPECIVLEPEVNLEKTGVIDSGWAEIQDISSQLTLAEIRMEEGDSWLDACAGAGGKSLFLISRFPGAVITATDIRKNILEEYRQRLRRNFPSFYAVTFVANWSAGVPASLTGKQFDGIIADVPCTGSGTWRRTPEQAYYFDVNRIVVWQELQRKIIGNLLDCLKPGGAVWYITCSVFPEENEGNIEFFRTQFSLTVRSARYVNGLSSNGDILYVAELVKP
ncbi:MAG: RsmB/NOP family class I SAM-dependent RNA methyltransferase [Bacteroidia bacterium]